MVWWTACRRVLSDLRAELLYDFPAHSRVADQAAALERHWDLWIPDWYHRLPDLMRTRFTSQRDHASAGNRARERICGACRRPVAVKPYSGKELLHDLHMWLYTPPQVGRPLPQGNVTSISRSVARWQVRNGAVPQEVTDLRAALRSRVGIWKAGQDFTYQPLPRRWHRAGGQRGSPAGRRRPAELKVLAPCSGSGHFLVEAFAILVRIRMNVANLHPRVPAIAVQESNPLFAAQPPRLQCAMGISLASTMPPMANFIELVRRLLDEGSVRLREPPVRRPAEREPVLALLSRAFEEYRLGIAGPPVVFAPTCALHAVDHLAWACWFLLHRGDPAAEMERCLPRVAVPRSASEHLSTDLVFRFLAQVHRRARAVNPQDPLTLRLEETLRSCPLSGVLADLDDLPLVEIDLDGHRGLMLLFAGKPGRAARVLPGCLLGRKRAGMCRTRIQRAGPADPHRREEPDVIADVVARLRHGVIEPLRERFVERGEVVDLIALALVAGEHLFLYGPPGTAKSALIRQD